MRRRPPGQPVAILAALLAVLVSASLPAAQPGSRRVAFHFINVGQADATLIMDEAKTCVILIDSGDTRYPESSKKFKAYMRKHLPPGSDIDLAIVSHPHNDHLGSMKWVLETYRVKTFIDNGQKYGSKIYDTLMTVVADQKKQQLKYFAHENVPASIATLCRSAGPRVAVLSSQVQFDEDVCTENANNCSVVAKISVGQTSFLFPGDAEDDEEELLLADAKVKADLRSTVLKVPHHGSDTSSGRDFLEAVKPSAVVVSVGEKNVGTNKGYKHPRLSTMQRLLAFAGTPTARDTVDVYDAQKREWTQMAIFGRFYMTINTEAVVLSTDGSGVNEE